jgi:peptidoglycan/LPS O-acetylase OafA/YrhL
LSISPAIDVAGPLASRPPAGQPRRAGPRNEALDAARLLGALAIIWIHAAASTSNVLGRFAVPFFTCVGILLVVEKGRREPLAAWPRWALARARRLYLPFLAWSAVYLAFKVVKKGLAPEQANDFGGWEMLVWGGAYHLWFLPFMLVASVTAFPMASLAGNRRPARVALAAVAGAAAVWIALLPCPGQWPVDHSARWLWAALPSAAVGCCWGLLARSSRTASSPSRLGLWLGVALFILSMTALAILGRSILLETAAGLGFGMAAIGWPAMKFPPLIVTLGQLAYGIYCSHLLFIKIGESLAAKLHLQSTTGLDIALFLAAAILSSACAWWLARWRATHWLVA